MRIAEPTTVLTDVLLGLECLVLGAALWRRGRRSATVSVRWMSIALLATGLGALLGAASHGLQPVLSGGVWEAPLWRATLWCIGVTAFFFLGAVAHATLGGSLRRLLVLVAAVELVVYLAWTLVHGEFVWAIADYVPAMVAALALAVVLARRGEPAAWPLLAGIALTFVGAAIQASGLTLHPRFNHNDLFHVVQMVAVAFLYRGGARLRDAGGVRPAPGRGRRR